MRFILIHKARVKEAKDFVDASGVVDVKIIPLGQEREPTSATLEALQSGSCRVALVGVRKEYKKALASAGFEPEVKVENVFALEQWLRPAGTPPPPSLPSVSFHKAALEPRLIFGVRALDRADDLAPLRYAFVARAADALVQLARKGTSNSPLEDFFAERSLTYAINGNISVTANIHSGSATRQVTTERHLKQGDSTTAESAARIYFHCDRLPDGGHLVLVLYCGPHPNQSFTVHVRIPNGS